MNSTKKTTTIEQAAELLQNRSRIALFSHTNPDGDTVGASAALCLALRKLGKQVSLFCDCPIEGGMAHFLHNIEFSRVFGGKFDLMVAVDCGDVFRVGEFSGIYANYTETLTIDHHGGEYFSKYNLLKKYASTCQIIYELFEAMHIKLDKDIATYLYMGLCTDTGNFMHESTDSACFAMAADLCKYDVPNEKISRVFFKDISLAKTKLIARVLSRMRTFYNEQMILIYVTKQDLDDFGLSFSDTTGIVQYAVNIESAKIGVVVSEHANNVYKVSMRGNEFSVREICQEFGGGGHKYASGCMISGFLEDVIEKIERVVGFYL